MHHLLFPSQVRGRWGHLQPQVNTQPHLCALSSSSSSSNLMLQHQMQAVATTRKASGCGS
jgi:hypothetical protein